MLCLHGKWELKRKKKETHESDVWPLSGSRLPMKSHSFSDFCLTKVRSTVPAFRFSLPAFRPNLQVIGPKYELKTMMIHNLVPNTLMSLCNRTLCSRFPFMALCFPHITSHLPISPLPLYMLLFYFRYILLLFHQITPSMDIATLTLPAFFFPLTSSRFPLTSYRFPLKIYPFPLSPHKSPFIRFPPPFTYKF
jgi:hypothetical protein